MSTETELLMSVGGFPPFSARGCSQELTSSPCGTFQRTVNGNLIYLGQKQQHKYHSTITGQDHTVLATEGLWRGSAVRVGCLQKLWQKITGKVITLEREAITGSVIALTAQRKVLTLMAMEGREIILEEEQQEGYVGYRPWLDMRVISFGLTTNEWELKSAWRLELEEI